MRGPACSQKQPAGHAKMTEEHEGDSCVAGLESEHHVFATARKPQEPAAGEGLLELLGPGGSAQFGPQQLDRLDGSMSQQRREMVDEGFDFRQFRHG